MCRARRRLSAVSVQPPGSGHNMQVLRGGPAKSRGLTGKITGGSLNEIRSHRRGPSPGEMGRNTGRWFGPEVTMVGSNQNLVVFRVTSTGFAVTLDAETNKKEGVDGESGFFSEHPEGRAGGFHLS